jgi:hypothetical protein
MLPRIKPLVNEVKKLTMRAVKGGVHVVIVDNFSTNPSL